MTGLPATLLGMIDQGYVMPGMAANITVFDPGTIAARSSYERPTELPEGVRFVLVNGELAVRDGKVTGRTAGRVLLRASDMPSRPESIGKRALRAQGRLLGPASTVPVSIAVEVSQNASDTHARGRLSVTDNLGRVLLETDSMGLLQTTERWASFTAYVPARGAVSLVVDEVDPLHRGVKWVRIRVGGKVAYEGALSR
jgi:hypothetical protein